MLHRRCHVPWDVVESLLAGLFRGLCFAKVLQCLSARESTAAVATRTVVMLGFDAVKCLHDDCFVSECRVLLKDLCGPMLGKSEMPPTLS